jgi:sRNA-binding protein
VSIFSRPTPAPPTLSEREAAAEAKAAAALSIFHTAAVDLDAAAGELDDVAVELDAQADALEAQATQARQRAEDAALAAREHGTAAARIRDLLGLSPAPAPTVIGDALVIESDPTEEILP